MDYVRSFFNVSGVRNAISGSHDAFGSIAAMISGDEPRMAATLGAIAGAADEGFRPEGGGGTNVFAV